MEEVKLLAMHFYIDKTHALHPLLMPEIKEEDEFPETFPTGLQLLLFRKKYDTLNLQETK
jgi:hypothetical protein